MLTENFQVKTEFETLIGTINYGKNKQPPTVISLHGGGPSNRNTTKYIAEYLAKKDLTVIRFDYSGQGESTGLMKESSLSKRLNETKKVLDSFHVNHPITVIGTSMGGHIASLLTTLFNVQCLILFCPAAYDRNAFDIPFTDEFTKIIRKLNSYENSNVFEILKQFKGKSLTIIGNNDAIIPETVIDNYNKSLKNSELSMFLRLDNCPHRVHVWLEKNEHARNKIFSAIDLIIG